MKLATRFMEEQEVILEPTSAAMPTVDSKLGWTRTDRTDGIRIDVHVLSDRFGVFDSDTDERIGNVYAFLIPHNESDARVKFTTLEGGTWFTAAERANEVWRVLYDKVPFMAIHHDSVDFGPSPAAQKVESVREFKPSERLASLYAVRDSLDTLYIKLADTIRAAELDEKK